MHFFCGKMIAISKNIILLVGGLAVGATVATPNSTYYGCDYSDEGIAELIHYTPKCTSKPVPLAAGGAKFNKFDCSGSPKNRDLLNASCPTTGFCKANGAGDGCAACKKVSPGNWTCTATGCAKTHRFVAGKGCLPQYSCTGEPGKCSMITDPENVDLNTTSALLLSECVSKCKAPNATCTKTCTAPKSDLNTTDCTCQCPQDKKQKCVQGTWDDDSCSCKTNPTKCVPNCKSCNKCKKKNLHLRGNRPCDKGACEDGYEWQNGTCIAGCHEGVFAWLIIIIN